MRGGPYPPGASRRHAKRIVMSPPQSFLDTSALTNTPSEQLNSPVVFGQNGQAAIVGDQTVLGQMGQQPQAGPVQPATQAAGSEPAPPPAQQLAQTAPEPPSLAITLVSSSASPTPTPIPTSAITTSILSSESSVSSLVPSDPSSTISFTSTSLPSEYASASSSPATHRAFIHTPAFIIVMVLSSLIVLAVIATLISFIYRRSCCLFPGRRRKDDDGLSDVVYSFHSHSRSNTLSQMGSLSALGLSGPSTMISGDGSSAGVAGLGMGPEGIDTMSEKEEDGVHRRSTMLAQFPGNSPFLHSGEGGFPVLHDISDVRDERRIHSPQPGTYGEMWEVPITPTAEAPRRRQGHDTESVADGAEERALEIRNWSPGDLDGRSSIVNWANQSSVAPRDPRITDIPDPNTAMAEQPSDQDLSRASSTGLSMPYLAPPDPRDYVPNSFISPANTMVDLSGPVDEKTEATPSRAGTWASNLRDTLFAAIQGTRPGPGDIEHDAYTRSPSLPSQSRRSVHRFLSRSSRDSRESDDAEAIGGHYLTPSLSSSTSRSRDARATKTAPLEQVSKLDAGERYKRSYGRVQANEA